MEQTASPSKSALSSTTEELFRKWQTKCFQKDSSTTSRHLQDEARSVFASFVTETELQIADKVIQTKSCHEEALAVMLRELGPAFSTLQQSVRVRALHCLLGALEGCQQEELSIKLQNLLGNFLLQHCGPIADEEGIDEEDYDEQVRDAAVRCSSILVQTKIHPGEEIPSIQFRLNQAQTGVEWRCAQPELDQIGHDRGYSRTLAPSGLSALPRSRRSLCFAFLRATANGIQPYLRESMPIADELIRFVQFATSCLHGESDPRCLQQLLNLFYSILTGFAPALKNNANFPIGEIYDAIAPYYPIQFKPPPNDPHGITREGLSNALLGIMTCTLYDAAAKAAGRETMFALSMGLIIERILPPEGEDPATLADQIEGLNDLTVLLFPAKDENNIDLLDAAITKHLSDAFLRIHDLASMIVAQGGPDTYNAKNLADSCRKLVSWVAIECERRTTKPDLWDTFVASTMQFLRSKLGSNPSKSKTAITYMANLAASGGYKTLQLGLEYGLVPLLELNSRIYDEDDITTALYGIAAFFSSSQMTVANAQANGVTIHPHPLKPYSSIALEKLSDTLMNTKAELPLRLAAVRALDSVLVASPESHFEQSHFGIIQGLVDLVTDSVVVHDNDDEDNEEEEDLFEWKKACSKSLGGFLGKSFDDLTGNPESDTIIQSDAFRTHLQQNVLGNILVSIKTNKTNSFRFDQKVLAIASSLSFNGAKHIIQAMLHSLYTSVQQLDMVEAVADAESLWFVLSHGGIHASQAFQENGDITVFSILDSMSKSYEKVDEGLEQNVGVSVLELPPIDEGKLCSSDGMKLYLKIVELLLPGYNNYVSADHLEKIIDYVGKRLPPLATADSVKVSISVPLLASALSKYVTLQRSSDFDENRLSALLGYLADFSMRHEFPQTARSFASSCVHISISKFSTMLHGKCPSFDVIQDSISPLIIGAMEDAKHYKPKEKVLATLQSAVSMIGLLGSAAAIRGKDSSTTADDCAIFLIDLSSFFVAGSSFLNGNVCDVSIVDHSYPGAAALLAICASSAFGLLFSYDRSLGLWRQRLAHIASKRLLDIAANEQRIPLGCMACSCHIICSTDIETLSASSVQGLTAIIIGSVKSQEDDSLLFTNDENYASLKRILLASIIKLLCIKSELLISNLHEIVVGIIRAYASSHRGKDQITCKLLALQALEAVSQIPGAHELLAPLKPSVTSILGIAMNEYSSALRSAAVEVRNSWYII